MLVCTHTLFSIGLLFVCVKSFSVSCNVSYVCLPLFKDSFFFFFFIFYIWYRLLLSLKRNATFVSSVESLLPKLRIYGQIKIVFMTKSNISALYVVIPSDMPILYKDI